LEFIIFDDDGVSLFLEGLEERPQRKHSLHNLLVNLQKGLMSQWNSKQ
jgi:hypothetical protein